MDSALPTAAPDLGLHPPHEPYDVRRFPVGEGHELHLEQAGNPAGVPVVFLHGGPGFTWSGHNRRFCDPAHYRFVGLDQRGAWRSTPLGRLEANSTQHLVTDLERIREALGIERWILFGGSWGSALALAYALAHRERCIALVLWGIYLGLESENHFNYVTSRKVFPEAWQALADHVGPEERGDLMTACERRIFDEDPSVYEPALRLWLAHNTATANLRAVPAEFLRPLGDAAVLLAGARIALTYFRRGIFLPEGHLLERAAALGDLPGWLVHGRDDWLCPIENAFDLSRRWPGARYLPVERAGHHPFEPGITRSLLAAMEAAKTLA